MKDSQKTQKLFDKAVTYISEVLETGEVVDEAVVGVALKAFTGHIKVKNTELRQDQLKFVVARVSEEDTKELKKILSNTLPEYSSLKKHDTRKSKNKRYSSTTL